MSFENSKPTDRPASDAATPTGPKIGYARVSTRDQNLDLQITLSKLSAVSVYKEAISGTKRDWPELNRALEHLRAGDTLVVWKLDRLGRSVKEVKFQPASERIRWLVVVH